MSGINLLPPESKQETARAKLNTLVITICLYLFLIFLFGSIGLESANRYYSIRLSQKETEIRTQESEIEKLKDVETSAQNLNSILSVVGEIEKNRTSWPPILREIAASAPQKLKITSLTINLQKTPVINIIGESETPRQTKEFATKMEASFYFSNVNLISIDRTEKQSGTATVTVYTFRMTMDLEKKKEVGQK